MRPRARGFCGGAKTDWVDHTLYSWIFIAVGRIGMYRALQTLAPNTLSDHIFLATSVIGMLQMELAHLQAALHHREKLSPIVYIAVAWAWIIIGIVLFECYNTAAYFHTRQESWVGFIAGTIIFNVGCPYFFLPVII